MKAGWSLPERIKNAPELLPGLEIYYMGFMDLMASRQIGMSIGPIWWETIQKYCEALGLDGEQTEAMHYHIKEMDGVYLTHMQKKNS